MPAKLVFFEAVAQLIPIVLLLTVIQGPHIAKRLLVNPWYMGGAFALLCAEITSLLTLATGNPTVFSTWLVMASLSFSIYLIGSEVRHAVAADPEHPLMLLDQVDEEDDEEVVRWFRTNKRITASGFLALFVFTAVPPALVIAATIAAVIAS